MPHTAKSLESTYVDSVPLSHRKKYAQFFTPERIADVMCKWLLAHGNVKSVLEPAFGLGVFSRKLLTMDESLHISGYEIDAQIFNFAKKAFDGVSGVTLLNEDYVLNGWDAKYDGIICNPPYFKFHDYENKRSLDELRRRLHYGLSGFTNLYAIFLLKSLAQLNEGGRCAYIVPSEFMNSDYGTNVKSILLKSGMLRHIIVFDPDGDLFDDAITTSCILLCENNGREKEVTFSYISGIQDFIQLEEVIASPAFTGINSHRHLMSNLNPSVKWKNYYRPYALDYTDLVPFSGYAKVMRGIATGDNDYFTFTKAKAEKYAIGTDYLLPCVCHAIDVKGNVFTRKDYEKLVLDGKKAYLLNAKDASDTHVIDYINHGMESHVDKRYLTSQRNPWFSLEDRRPSPIWVSVFNRSGLRFVRNIANVSNLTTFHCVYPALDIFQETDIDFLFAYLITETAATIFSANSREYGNGLSKFEPNDLNRGMMLNINLIPQSDKRDIMDLYAKFEESGEKSYVRQIDAIFAEDFRFRGEAFSYQRRVLSDV